MSEAPLQTWAVFHAAPALGTERCGGLVMFHNGEPPTRWEAMDWACLSWPDGSPIAPGTIIVCSECRQAPSVRDITWSKAGHA